MYKITYADDKKYIGVRSCNCAIEDDPYMGSPFHLPEKIAPTGVKTILSTHSTREEAMLEEIRLHAKYDVKNNPEYYNQCNSTSVKFQVSKEAHQRSAETRRGRIKETHEYIRKQVEARAKYAGNNRTEAQKAQFSKERMPERMKKYKETFAKNTENPEFAKRVQDARVRGGKSCKGIKNPKKGHTGLEHPKAKSWWYIKPNQEKVIVNDSIRNYCKNNPGEFPISSASIMRYIRENKVPTKLTKLGWDFGNNGQELTTLAE